MKRLGCFPDPYDARDLPLASLRLDAAYPSSFSLREWEPGILDQGSTESCVGNAVVQAYATAANAARRKRELTVEAGTMPSRLLVYWLARHAHNASNIDRGTYIRAAFKTIKGHGLAPESDWPFEASEVNTQPPQRVFQAAFPERGPKGYYRIGSWGQVAVEDCARAIASGAVPVVGLLVDEAFTRDRGPDRIGHPFLTRTRGGHALSFTAYERRDGDLWFWTPNSWGADWRGGGAWLHEGHVRASFDRWAVAV